MNNCPKCGNPLQEGITVCPICGTNILNKEVAPAAPTAEATPVVAPVEQPTNVTPVAPETTPAPVAVEGIAPTVERVESSSPIPGIPSSVAQNSVAVNTQEPLVANPNLTAKKKKNKMVPIIAVVILVVVGIGCYFLLTPQKNNKNNNINNNVDTSVAMSDMNSNGYYLKIAEGWSINEDGDNVILTNEESTVAIKLEHSKANLNTIDQKGIENILLKNESYKEVEVTTIDVSGKNAYLVSTKVNEFPVQMYFINGGANLIMGATIVYQSNDTKDKYEGIVTEIIGTLSYSEASVKAIETISQYSQMFGIYSNVIYNLPQSESNIPDMPDPEEQDSENDQNIPLEEQKEQSNNEEHQEEPVEPEELHEETEN